MSEPSPEPGPPLDPDELSRLDDIIRDARNTPDFVSAGIDTMAGMDARWYFSWQAAGVPENRAAEWAEVMIAARFRSDTP